MLASYVEIISMTLPGRSSLAMGLICISVAVVGVVLLGGWPSSRSLSPNQLPATTAKQELIIPESMLNLGEVWEQADLALTLPITNTSVNEVNIDRFTASCGCVSVVPSQLTLGPGETRDLQVRLDLTVIARKSPFAWVREFKATFVPYVGSRHGQPKALQGWEIVARVRSPNRAEPPVAALGRHSELATELPAVTLKILSHDPSARLEAKSNSSHLRTQLEPAGSIPGIYNLHLKLENKLPVGPIGLKVELTTILANGTVLPSRQIDVTGEILSDVQASPSALLLGSLRMGTSKEETIALQSITGSEFQIIDFVTEGKGLSVTESRSAESKEHNFVLTQLADQTGLTANRVVFRVRQSTNKLVHLPILITYRGES